MSLMLISSWGNQVITDLSDPSHPLDYSPAHLLINLQSAIVDFPQCSRLLVQVLQHTKVRVCLQDSADGSEQGDCSLVLPVALVFYTW